MKANEFMIASLKHKVTALEKTIKELEDQLTLANTRNATLETDVKTLKSFIRRASSNDEPNT